MKNKILVVLISCCLGGCLLNPGLFKPEPIKGACSKAGDSFNLGRISIDVNLGEDWRYIHHPGSERIKFNYNSFNPVVGVMVSSYSGSNRDIDFDDIQDIRENEESNDVITGNAVRHYRPEFEVEVLSIGQLECVRSFDLWHAPVPAAQYQTPLSGGVEKSVRYLCPVPSQRGWLPIKVSVVQSVGRGVTGFDMDNIAQSIIESIEINPSPPENPKAIPTRMFESWTTAKDDFLKRKEAGEL